MAYCTNCGTKLEDNGICPKCAAEAEEAELAGNKKAKKVVEEFQNAPDSTEEFDKEDIEKNRFFAILAYFGILIIVPIMCVPNSKFARFHAAQSLDIIIYSFVYAIIATILTVVCFNYSSVLGFIILGIFILLCVIPFVFWIQGIGNAAAGKAKELAFIGKLKLL